MMLERKEEWSSAFISLIEKGLTKEMTNEKKIKIHG